jgi:hypothetical protein
MKNNLMGDFDYHRVHKTISITKEEEKMPQNEGGIDKLLQTLKGPKQINTVSKSAMDWDNYKEKEGISDEIAAVSKDGLVFLFHVEIALCSYVCVQISGQAGLSAEL